MFTPINNVLKYLHGLQHILEYKYRVMIGILCNKHYLKDIQRLDRGNYVS